MPAPLLDFDDDDWVQVSVEEAKLDGGPSSNHGGLNGSTTCTVPQAGNNGITLSGAGISNVTSFGTMGKGERILRLGMEAVLIDHLGDPGCLTHFWFGGNFPGVENTRIRYYVDGEENPSIDMELYLGHGIGFGDNSHVPWITKHIGKVGRKNGIHNNYRIPFSFSIRVTAERVSKTSDEVDKSIEPISQDEKDDKTVPPSWWIIRGLTGGWVSFDGRMLPSSPRLRLHLAKLENYTAKPLEEFNLCNIVPPDDIGGSGETSIGALFQVTIVAQSTTLAFLEACMRAYHAKPSREDDSDTPFMMLSSGLEDYFLGTYYFDSGSYQSDISGLTHFDRSNSSFSAYRFHDQDLVLIPSTGLRLTCRCGETEHGTKDKGAYMHPQPTTYTTYVWYYLWV
ncbi:expressed unknown protein [Seminavis robusta]|uniref:Uncharacterized protein n=1 Tax=Seminavis robusta TaxID=568900 RepID=A0A9N8ES62_9STRA|nr:expressed unknown protein [Seminavis robusta]|eukprot:Sro1799_g298420.1 n/a (396) ;mRNA; r:20215-21402